MNAESANELLPEARSIYAQYMRQTLEERGDSYDEASLREVEQGRHDGKHGVQIALLALRTIAMQRALIERLRRINERK